MTHNLADQLREVQGALKGVVYAFCIGGPTKMEEAIAIMPALIEAVSALEAQQTRTEPVQSGTKLNMSSDAQACPSGVGVGWQKIETAPRDGTEILMGEYNRDGRFFQTVGFWDADRDPKWYGTKWQASEYDAFNHAPTHWIPLPAAPLSPSQESTLR